MIKSSILTKLITTLVLPLVMVLTLVIPASANGETPDKSSPISPGSVTADSGKGATGLKGNHYHFFGSQLATPQEKQLYNTIEQELLVNKARTETSAVVFSSPLTLPSSITADNEDKAEAYIASYFQRTLDAFRFDHPEFYWISGNAIVTDMTLRVYSDKRIALHSISAYFEPHSTGVGTDAKINAAVSEIVVEAKKQTGDYAKLKTIHDMLAKSMRYNKGNLTYGDFQISGGLAEGKGVCEAYAKSFKVVADKLGYKTILVAGMSVINGQKVPHMWNYVKVGDSWYAVDVTWDDQATTIHDFFLVGTNTTAPNFKSTFASMYKEDYVFSTADYKNFGYPKLSPTAYKG